MPVLDASALNTDPEGLAFLRDVLGTEAEKVSPERRFPVAAWTPKLSIAAGAGSSAPAAAPATGRIGLRLAEELA